MLEEPKIPNVSEPAGETPSEDRLQPSKALPDENEELVRPAKTGDLSPESRPVTSGQDSSRAGSSLDTGNLLRRLTGSLRRITGSLGGEESQKNPPSLGDSSQMRKDLLDDLSPGQAPLPEQTSIGRAQSEETARAVDSGELRRMTGDLDLSRAVPTPGEIPDSSEIIAPHESFPDVQEMPDTGSLMRRLTGPIRRDTGPLGQTAPLTPSGPDQIAIDGNDLSGFQDSSSGSNLPQGGAGKMAANQGAGNTGNLIRRITGSLRRVTGSLGDTAPLGSVRKGERASTEEGSIPADVDRGISQPPLKGELGEKRKRGTGQLGSVIAGILRGSSAETPQEPAVKPPQPDDYLSDIRHDLASEEDSKPNPQGRGTGKLLQFIKRMTGSQEQTSPLKESRVEKSGMEPSTALPMESPGDEMQAEIEEVMLEDRLAGTAPSEPAVWAMPEDIIIELEPSEPEGFELGENPPAGVTGPLQLVGDEPISLLDSGAIAALGQAEEESRREETRPDWMAEIRQEAAAQEAESHSAEEEEKHKGITGPLRDFISGILRPEEKQQQPASEAELSDDLFSGRLGIDSVAGQEEVKNLPAEPLAPEWEEFNASTTEENFPPVETAGLSIEDDSSFLERFQSRFEQLSADETGEAGQAPVDFSPFPPAETEKLGEDFGKFVPYQPLPPQAPEDIFTISAEDEKLLWGKAPDERQEESKIIPVEDLWSSFETQSSAPEPGRPEIVDDAVVAAFQTRGALPGAEEKPRRRVTGRLSRETGKKPFEDIRSILLDDYQAADLQRQGKPAEKVVEISAAPDVSLAPPELGRFEQEEEALSPARPKNLKAWLKSRTTLQKVILVELALVILALLVLVPLFLTMMMRGQIFPGNGSMTPRALPADMPYPVALTLPGGWAFDLGRSTVARGEWEPVQSEWLEGTELRRVVALPWNPQTEAVVQTFQPGDKIDLLLNNQDMIQYEIEQVGRVKVSDVSVYSDSKPSLAIILYKEDAPERWVIICKR